MEKLEERVKKLETLVKSLSLRIVVIVVWVLIFWYMYVFRVSNMENQIQKLEQKVEIINTIK